MWFRRRRRGADKAVPTAPPLEVTPEVSPPNAVGEDVALLARTIARHFDPTGRPGSDPSDVAQVDGADVRFDGLGLVVTCRVDAVDETMSGAAAALTLILHGPMLGAFPVPTSITGYGDGPAAAIAEGAGVWCRSFAPAIRSGLRSRDEPDAEHVDAVLDGRPYRVHVGNLDRLLRAADDPDDDAGETIRSIRRGLGGEPLLVPVILRSGLLPVLPPDAISVVGVFVVEQRAGRTVEVVVGGREWAPRPDAFLGCAPSDHDGIALLRELAVLVPTGAAGAPTRPMIERTLRGLAAAAPDPQNATGWPGWRAHAGRLAAPLPAAGTDDLPTDYRRFLTEVAASGAGPGYGLLPPRRVGTVVPLAFAGCGITWILRLDDPHHGEVWAEGADRTTLYRRVAASFDEWYSSWLDAAVRSGPWVQWDADQCPTVSALAGLLVDRGGAASAMPTITLGPPGPYEQPGETAARPCHACVALVARLGYGPDVFTAGSLR